VGEYDKNKMVSSLSGENHLDFLRSKKLLDDEMYHPLSQHIKATIL
jgi:hypothetical protein